MTSGPSPSTARWRLTPLVAMVRCSRAIAGRHSEGATALSNRMPGLSLPRAGRIMIGMASRDRFLLCTPRFYRVEYVINPWMEGNVGRTDAEEAMRQWEALRAALAARADLELLEPAAGLPDMPFTANAGLVHDDTFVPARFRFPQRAPETPDAFDRDSLDRIAARVPAEQRCEVDAADALHVACNAVVTGGAVITNFASDALRERLERWGHEVVLCPLGQFMLAGGAAKCLVLQLEHPGARRRARAPRVASEVRERAIEIQGDLLDTGLMNAMLDRITDGGGDFEIEAFQPGLRHDQASLARVRVVAPSPERLDAILARLIQAGARVAEDGHDARLEAVEQEGVAPHDFYSTSIFPTDVRVRGRWVRAARQRMDAVLVVDGAPGEPRVTCRLIRELRRGDLVVCGVDGVRTEPTHVPRGGETFGFMTADASSERRVELAVERIAWEMRRLRERGGKVVVVASPVVIHTGGGPHLARLVHRGYVQALLGGNGPAAHDIEQALFGTSLGVDLKRGIHVQGGHRNHLVAINLVRAHGGIREAVNAGAVRSGVMYESVRHGVPFALAGSIRDDGPLPDTLVDLIAAQAEYARLIEGADMILMLSSMLHSIGVGNMTPAGVRLICVDISPAVVTKLADRGSVESTGIVTDVGLFLNLLDAALRG